MLERKPFERQHERKVADTFTIKLNERERKEFEVWKGWLQQPKDSTAMKQMARIGSQVLLSDLTRRVLEVCLNNYRRSRRLGIVEFDQNLGKSDDFGGDS